MVPSTRQPGLGHSKRNGNNREADAGRIVKNKQELPYCGAEVPWPRRDAFSLDTVSTIIAKTGGNAS